MKNVLFNSTLIMLILLCSGGILFAQNLLNQPESVTWDHVNEQWLVSNYASGEIIIIDSAGEHSIFSDILNSTVGLKIHGDNLFAASSDGVAMFDLASGNIIGLVNIPEAALLNDIDFDLNGNLFVSDYWGNQIFKVDTELFTYELFIDYGIIAPNGMIFDEEFNRMIVCGHNGSVAMIHSFDVETAETEFLLYPNIYSLDGLARDIQGNIYISSWHTDAVYKFVGNNINNNIELAASGFIDPADIYINPTNNILAVPNFNDNSVSFVQLDNPVSAYDESIPYISSQLNNYPNPFNPTTTISFETYNLRENARIDIYNIRGQKVKEFDIILSEVDEEQNSVVWKGMNQNNQPVSSGIYYAVLTQNGETQAFRKMILMK
ncbi:MAG: T9SS type A sorting domain-containing protein [Candidatus Cloacimonetes bacterium]|jgi:DNA-binding beta-propeller fold protein YncE|nr:T9SS type A sorting domain-containing protein [Candidatus Cloacimonadota bacterium]MBT4332185.1 T9SS type A sorting domain-containing protein [Candidatus Cloacimonadota bacterium]MBT4576039.1 T9SS type A sorting domain-containing protein [Candidatus Cloacimonadota bacterium]